MVNHRKKKVSNAQAMRQSRQRLKADPIRYAEYLQKEKDRYRKRKNEGKLKTIHDLNSSEQRRLRRKWKLDKRRQRKSAVVNATVTAATPPPSPETLPAPPAGVSSQGKAGRKRVRREDRQSYRTIEKQKRQIKSLENKLKQMRRQLNREKSQNQKSNTLSPKSPASKARKLINDGNKEKIRRELTFGLALSANIMSRLKENGKRRKEKNDAHKVVVGPILKKYRLLAEAKAKLAVSDKGIRKFGSGPSTSKQHARRTNPAAPVIREFFLRDDVSMPTAGKRETITRAKNKKQKRILTDSLKNLFEKFRSEFTIHKVSYTTFTRFRPFYVVPPPPAEKRETMKCKIHYNAELKALKLHHHGVLKSGNLSALVENVVCSTEERACMYRECRQCKDNMIHIYADTTLRSSKEKITYSEWNSVKEQRQSHKGEIEVQVTKKVTKEDSITNLCVTFEDDFQALLMHEYRISHQFKSIRQLKETLKENECILQID